MSGAVIEIRALSRWYGDVIGLAGFSAEIQRGVIGLLGPNGAGKSTLFKCLAGLLRPDRGEVRIFGQSTFARPQLYRRIGLCPEVDPFYEDMRGSAWLELIARWAGYSRREARGRAARALERVGMQDLADKRIAGMSKGMRQRIKFAQAIVHDPEVLLLDEPLTGMDPIQRHHVLDLIAAYEGEGRTILVSSHILHEVEALTDRILLLREGRLLAEGTVRDIRDHFASVPRRIQLRSTDPRPVARAALDLDSTAGVQFGAGGDLTLATRRPEELLAHLTAAAAAGELDIREIHPADEDLTAIMGLLGG